jgi:predicted nuclease with TOPRIM domain
MDGDGNMQDRVNEIRKRTEIAEEEGLDTQQFDDLYALLGMVTALQEENDRLKIENEILSESRHDWISKSFKLQNENATLKKALEIACKQYLDLLNLHYGNLYEGIEYWVDDFMKQALSAINSKEGEK